MRKLNRRKFIQATTGAAAAAATTPRLAFSADDSGDNIFVYVFQRGGSDGLSLHVPMDGHPDRGNYEALRLNGTRIESADLQPTSAGWGLHPAAAPLLDLWSNQSLAIVQAVGLLPYPNRSHFEAERYIELGTPGDRFTTTGWLTRHLQTAKNLPPSLVLPAVVTESTIRLSLLGEPSAVSMRYPYSFDFDSDSTFEEEQEAALADIYGLNSSDLDIAGSQAMTAQSIVEAIDWTGYVPDNGASYPLRTDTETPQLTSFGYEMRVIAQLIKENTGLRLAETDIGGWDSHNEQGNQTPEGPYYERVRDMSEALLAFFTDLDIDDSSGKNRTWADRTTLIVYSEFGRRAYDNADAGTDHGWGNNMLAMGAGVNGGKLYGAWPGLATDDLYQKADIYAQTDFRTVLTEMLLKRLHNDQISQIFPEFTESQYQPLGVFNGSFIDGDFNDGETMFRSGME
jgi:uncharacterized protein (DUF1501 family)